MYCIELNVLTDWLKEPITDQLVTILLLYFIAVDRAVTASISDARDALMNAVIDPLKAYKESNPQISAVNGVFVPRNLRHFPLYIHSLLKHVSFL